MTMANQKYSSKTAASQMVVTAFLICAGGSVLAQPAQVGVNAAIRNSVQMKTAADAALRPARLREDVHIGDAVASGADSSLQVLLLDRSVFTVGANASVTIDRFVYDPDRGTGDIAASVAKGAFRFMSGRLQAGAGSQAIKTPVATIGVRGTIVQGLVGPDVADVLAGEPGIPSFSGNLDGATLVLLDGPGGSNQGFDKPGAIDVTIGGQTFPIEHPGYAILVWGPGQPPFGPFKLSDEAFAKLTILLIGNPENAQSENINPPPSALGDIVPPPVAGDNSTPPSEIPVGGQSRGK